MGRAAYMRSYRATAAGREANRRNTAKSWIRRKLRLLAGRTACERCGFDDIRALQFHHPAGVRKETLLGKYRKLTDEAITEAARCQVLCANCHTIEHTTWDPAWIHEVQEEAK